MQRIGNDLVIYRRCLEVTAYPRGRS
jgi:hypothetical protein